MITFRMGGWRHNVSLLGLMNVLDHCDKKYEISDNGQTLSINEEILNGFEKNYFKYFIDSYEKNLPWYRIASYKSKIEGYLVRLPEIDEKALGDINAQIDMIKDYMRRPNYTKIYEFIDKTVNIVEKINRLNKINLRKGEVVKEKIGVIEIELRKLKEIIDFSSTDAARDYMGAKGVIYNYINRGLDGVSFLNRQTKEKDIFIDYKKYFLDTLTEYIVENKEKFKYKCFSCNTPMKDLKTNMNLVKDTGFDQERKSSYIWNHESDFCICKKCLFLYSCFSAGFFYSMNEGMFINYNYDLMGLRRVNNELKKHSINETSRPENAFSYRTLVTAIEKEYQRHIRFEIRDMQIVRYKDERYIFNLLTKDALEVINESKRDLNSIINASYSEKRKGEWFFVGIYDLVLDRIFNNQNLFSLIHLLVVSLITEREGIKKYFNIFHVSKVLKINSRIVKEGNTVIGGKDIGKLTDSSRASGYYLRKDYNEYMGDLKRVDNRMKSITYKMTNALKTNNGGSFMDILINSYAYVGKPIPMHLVEALKDNEKLRIIGYAFVVGINSYEKESEGNKNEN